MYVTKRKEILLKCLNDLFQKTNFYSDPEVEH